VRQRDYARKDDTMQFVVHCHDKTDGGARRAPLRDEHADYLKANSDIVVVRGPLLDDAGDKTIGSLLILDVADRAAAEAFWADEPFNAAGVYEWTTIERWRFGHV
ncbi:MAG: YciI family protein, partial [Alphaproteobacteria bacterium]